uniref:Aprataxin n=1 Tax=Eptatretus burgeri TaxID=7764 RepID=A0A8C4QBF6_EPTBU
MLLTTNCPTQRFGFHWPPFTSVDHLHLHVLAPASQMGLLSRLAYRPGSPWFVTADWLLQRLKKMPEDKGNTTQTGGASFCSKATLHFASNSRQHLLWSPGLVKEALLAASQQSLASCVPSSLFFFFVNKGMPFARAERVLVASECPFEVKKGDCSDKRIKYM